MLNGYSFHYLKNLWRWKSGVKELDYRDTSNRLFEINKLEVTEWSEEFEQLMKNRLQQGAFRYGAFNTDKPQYDRISSIISRLKKYSKSGNTELLVDAANLCLTEFVEGNHPKKHFKAIDDGEHVSITQ